jgi:biopolymer transport protein ExbD
MNFYTRKRRAPAIIIVSLIDILAILLIFFIVTTTFKKKQPQLEINLPESRTAAPAAQNPSEPLVLRVKDENQILLGEDPVALDSLPEQLKAAIAAEPDRPIAMQADRDAPFGVVVQVLDALKDAGIKNIPAFTDPKPKSPTP